jgi:hypothetical protein
MLLIVATTPVKPLKVLSSKSTMIPSDTGWSGVSDSKPHLPVQASVKGEACTGSASASMAPQKSALMARLGAHFLVRFEERRRQPQQRPRASPHCRAGTPFDLRLLRLAAATGCLRAVVAATTALPLRKK